PAQMLIDQDELRFLQGQLQQKQKDYDDLTIRAPFDGWLVAPRLSDLPGRYLERGNEIAMVATLDTLVVRTLIDQKDGQLTMLPNDPAPEVRLAGQLGKVLIGRRAREVPAAHT